MKTLGSGCKNNRSSDNDKMDRYFLCARYYAKSFSYLALVLSLFPITDEKVGLQRPSNLPYVAVSTEMGEPGFEFES